MIKTKRITVNDIANNQFYQLPKFLFEGELKEILCNDAKLLYALLKDRHSLSIENGWKNENSEVYFIYSREDMQDMLGCSYNTAKKALDQLKEIGLIEDERIGQNKTNRIYLMAIDVEIVGSSKYEIPRSSKYESPGSSKNESPGSSKNECTDFQNMKPNKTEINNTENNKTNSSDTEERVQLRRLSRRIDVGNIPMAEVDDNPRMTSQIRERIRWLSQDDDAINMTRREKEMFELFILERKRRGKATTRVQRNAMIQNLYLFAHDESARIEIMEKTIAKGWNDIYPLDRGAPGAADRQEEECSYGNGSF